MCVVTENTDSKNLLRAMLPPEVAAGIALLLLSLPLLLAGVGNTHGTRCECKPVFKFGAKGCLAVHDSQLSEDQPFYWRDRYSRGTCAGSTLTFITGELDKHYKSCLNQCFMFD